MSDTPRTDAETWREDMNLSDAGSEIYVGQQNEVPADFARQLERELNELQARFDERTAAYDKKDAEQFLLIGQLRYSAEMWKRELRKAVEVLREIEWSGRASTVGTSICSVCLGGLGYHKTDCRLAAILKKHEATI